MLYHVLARLFGNENFAARFLLEPVLAPPRPEADLFAFTSIRGVFGAQVVHGGSSCHCSGRKPDAGP
jgi:hypothetical protein